MSERVAWEYKVYRLDHDLGDTARVDLETYGNDGWELTTIVVDQYGAYIAFFKRPVVQAP